MESGEFPLPEVMIQHVQSFLGAKAAAQTTILSKSWHSAWSTRPNLEFDMTHFGRHIDLFWKFMENTMQRYVELNLKIESFRLYLDSMFISDEKSMNIIEESIVKAMKIGTVDFNFGTARSVVTLPREVLRSETLIRLSLFRCKIDLGEERKVSCSVLKSLSLTDVEMGSDTLWDIVSSCPLIENLIIWPPKFTPSLGSVVSGPVNLYQLYKLKSLILCGVNVDSSFFSDLSSKFPFLKVLILNCFGRYQGIELSSLSLECVSFAQYYDYDHQFWAKCNVPNILKFKFSSLNFPSLSFKTASREWESDISIYCNHGSARWFLKLNKFLECFSLSRISLSLSFFIFLRGVVDVVFQGLRKTTVENLNIDDQVPLNPLLLLKCLIQSCRPKFINHNWYSSVGGNVFLRLVYKTLVLGARGGRSKVFVVQDLEEVNVEVFEESVAEWRPFPWNKVLKKSSLSKKMKLKLRLHLRWRPEIL